MFLASWLWLLLCAPLASAADYVEVEPGVKYVAGTRIGGAAYGVSVEVPDGWTALLPPGEEALILSRPMVPGLVLLAVVEAVEANRAVELLSQSQPLPPTLVLEPTGPAVLDGDRVRASYVAVNPMGQQIGGRAVAVLGKQVMVLIIGAGPASPTLYEGVTEALAGSVRWEAVKSPPKGDGPVGVASGRLAQQLGGKQVLHYSTTDYSSNEYHFMMCSDGRAFYSHSGGASDLGATSNFSMASQANAEGTWRVSGHTLSFVWNDGTRRDFTVNDQLKITSDEKYWVQPQSYCP